MEEARGLAGLCGFAVFLFDSLQLLRYVFSFVCCFVCACNYVSACDGGRPLYLEPKEYHFNNY